MKNIKAIGLIFLALLFGLAAAVYATGWISRQSGIASNKVVVAAVDIDLGSRVNAQMLSTVDWPSGSVPNGSFSDIKALNDRVVKVGVLRGEALMEGKLAPVGTQGGLSAVIASGKRAMTVRVNDVVGVAGFALPGNYVDVMVNAQQDKGRGEDALQISKTVLEKVLVLAVAQEANRDDTKPKVVSAVTLELSLEDSEARPGAQRGHPVARAAQPDGQDHGRHPGHHQGAAVRREEGHRAGLHRGGSGSPAGAAGRSRHAASHRMRGGDPERRPFGHLFLIVHQEEHQVRPLTTTIARLLATLATVATPAMAAEVVAAAPATAVAMPAPAATAAAATVAAAPAAPASRRCTAIILTPSRPMPCSASRWSFR